MNHELRGTGLTHSLTPSLLPLYPQPNSSPPNSLPHPFNLTCSLLCFFPPSSIYYLSLTYIHYFLCVFFFPSSFSRFPTHSISLTSTHPHSNSPVRSFFTQPTLFHLPSLSPLTRPIIIFQLSTHSHSLLLPFPPLLLFFF